MNINGKNDFIVGVDEAGRGPLAGPVVAAAVVFHSPIPAGLADSKKLSAKRRQALVPMIQQAAHWSVSVVPPEDIDRLNILQASLLAMRQAVSSLPPDARYVILVDGNVLPDFSGVQFARAETLIGGDALEAAISAASILAKEHRDALMRELDVLYPQYGFAKHSGYGVPAHMAALSTHGASPQHRKSFAPVAKAIAQHAAFRV